MKKTPCRCCKTLIRDMTKRFDPLLGYVCEECHAFSAYSDLRLRRVGIEGSILNPVRFAPSPTPNPETP